MKPVALTVANVPVGSENSTPFGVESFDNWSAEVSAVSVAGLEQPIAHDIKATLIERGGTISPSLSRTRCARHTARWELSEVGGRSATKRATLTKDPMTADFCQRDDEVTSHRGRNRELRGASAFPGTRAVRNRSQRTTGPPEATPALAEKWFRSLRRAQKAPTSPSPVVPLPTIGIGRTRALAGASSRSRECRGATSATTTIATPAHWARPSARN